MLGGDFVVESSVGHIRDLPRRADEVPAAYKGEGWARLGVDVDDGVRQVGRGRVREGHYRQLVGLLVLGHRLPA